MVLTDSPRNSSPWNNFRRCFARLLFLSVLLACNATVERACAADLYIGTTSTPETNTISSGTSAYQSTVVGYSGDSSNNLLVVTGSGTVLTNSLYIELGKAGLGNNQLLVTNGGSVKIASYTWIGDNSGNSVVVAGAGTTYANNIGGGGYFSVGRYGSSNSFTASGGSTVNIGSEAAIGQSNGSSFNYLLVADSGTTFTSSTNIRVGYGGSSNNLTVSNGAVMSVAGFTRLSESSTSTGNSALITGTGSLLTNSWYFFVGFGGASNSLTVSDGGTLKVATNTFLGFSNTSTGNSLLVAGTGSLFTNSGLIYLGLEGSGNNLTVSNGGTVSASGDYSFMGYYASSGGNTAVVTGTGSLFTNSGDLYLGFQGAANSLTVSDGGTVRVATDTYIGTYSTASNSVALVSGAGALLTNTGDIVVGYEAAGNSLTISNGGAVAGRNFIAGYNTVTATNNTLLVTGAGSTLTAAESLQVGFVGGGIATATDGGSIIAASNIVLAVSNGSAGVLNIGRFGASESAGAVTTPEIQFGDGTGTVNFNQTNSYTLTAAITGTGTVNQLGTGTTTLAGESTSFTALAVQGGTMRLDVSTGPAVSGSVSVAAGATLFLASSNQVADTAAVTLSGGTIMRGSGVMEIFGNLNLTGDSIIDFGIGSASSLNFGTYTGGGFNLNVTNFSFGNVLTFKTDLTDTIDDTNFFEFDKEFTSNWDGDTDTFTITSVPEPTTGMLLLLGATALYFWKRRTS